MQEHVVLKSGDIMPRLGMGTWYLGEIKEREEGELRALKEGIDSGARLIDTAEMYGNGLSERLVAKAIKDYDRSSLFVVSKVLPSNAGGKRISQSLDRTLNNLKTDYLDLYLLHWRSSIPLEETVFYMERFVKEGKIKNWGVSNFDTDDMKELYEVPNGENCSVNQVLYHLGSRGVEYDLLPWLKEHHIPLMAYCPLAQAGELKRSLLKDSTLRVIASKYNISVMQLLLLFVLRDENVIAIPRSGRKEHIIENLQVRNVQISPEDMREIEGRFPAPKHKVFLDIV